jgi:hypothetical protein
MRYGNVNAKLPPLSSARLSHRLPSCVLGLPFNVLWVESETSLVEPGAAYIFNGPIRTVTVMVCGASTTLAAPFTVTLPVYVPAASAEVFSANWIGTHVALALVVVQVRGDPTDVAIHETDDTGLLNESEPSPAL